MIRLADGVRCLALLFAFTAALALADDPSPVLPAGQKPDDMRLKPQRTLNDKFHPWTPPETKEAWEKAAERIRRQLLVSNGLWPLPEKTPLNAVIHGKVDRGDYTVEKVLFCSRPGVYVTGSLYRPKAPSPEKRPAVLCPHGHWQDGRFYTAKDKEATEVLASGGESYLSGAYHPLQAIEVQLARMGCVAFIFDTVGTADNLALPHREGFNDVAAELWSQNKMGLQTWNSIRALDFIESLPDVDPRRIGVTGASGGGTQTFMLCGLDPRPAVAFPAVMVGTAMQGGCQCENASYLRQDINNVAIAALIAPRPLGMTGANDWTIDIETRGLPELKKIYGFYNKWDNVQAVCFPQFPHNYNEVSREQMFAWMARHFGLKNVPVEQSDFWPMTREQLTVFDDKHPRPTDWLSAEQLRAEMTKESRAQMESLAPGSAEKLARYRDVVGGAADVMFGPLTITDEVAVSKVSQEAAGNIHIHKVTLNHAGRSLPAVMLLPENASKDAVLWIDGRGKSQLAGDDGKLRGGVRKLLEAGHPVASVDVFLTGEFLGPDETPKYPVNAGFPGYTLGYNRPLLVHRVRDIVLAATALRQAHGGRIRLVGTGDAGLWVLLARAAMGTQDDSTLVDLNGFSFTSVTTPEDPQLLPGALRFGDVDGLAALASGGRLQIHRPQGELTLLRQACEQTKTMLKTESTALDDEAVAAAILAP